ncbi:MAG: GtrA family protein [Patescibacteria group bacterium]
MTVVSRKDFTNAIITGLTAGLLAWAVLTYLQKSLPYGFAAAWLVLIIPILWIAGVQLGYILGRWFGFFNQFGKYAATGFTNFAVDAGVLNLLFSLTHIAEGPIYSLEKGASFLVAVTHSYYWNRRWAFQSDQLMTRKEFTKFMIVNIIGLIINNSVASAIVHFIPHTASPEVWGNVGAIGGAAVALIFNFIGFRILVFK